MKRSKRTKKSNSWKIKQHRDPYFKKSKTLGYRSRASFKLIELNEKYRFIKKNSNLLDLGSCPGGWSQVAGKIITNGKILSIDIKMQAQIRYSPFSKPMNEQIKLLAEGRQFGYLRISFLVSLTIPLVDLEKQQEIINRAIV